MREIKFRAWEESRSRMVEGVIPNYEMASSLSIGGEYIMVNPEKGYPVMQYTGLKDKNGVEIYEGDLLGNTMEGYAIAWDEELHSFWPINQYIPEEKSDVHWYEVVEMANQGRLEVIGNIYENPELLEAEL